jgi:hypothetical protein
VWVTACKVAGWRRAAGFAPGGQAWLVPGLGADSLHPFSFLALGVTVGALLFAALGFWVLLVRRRDSGNVAFAIFVIAYAAATIVINISWSTHWGQARNLGPIIEALWIVVAVAACWLALRLPIPVSRQDLPALVAAGALGAALLSLRVTPWDLYTAAIWSAAFAIALRWRSYRTAAARSGAALMSVAIALYHATQRGSNLGALAMGTRELDVWLMVQIPMPFLLAAVWLFNSARGGGRTAAVAAWIVLGAVLAGLLSTVGPGEMLVIGQPLMRLLGFVILAYAIVRHQVLGAAARFRWAISKSTLAAIFVSVFFVASEVAQEFFGDRFESGYLGIAAAGALVFVLAPLSRLADMIAQKALPQEKSEVRARGMESEDTYRRAIRLALRDRQLTRAEEQDLFHLASALGLDAGRAHEIFAEMERRGGPA